MRAASGLGRLVRRYEPVAATVAVVVLIAAHGPGGDRRRPHTDVRPAPTIRPFTSAAAADPGPADGEPLPFAAPTVAVTPFAPPGEAAAPVLAVVPDGEHRGAPPEPEAEVGSMTQFASLGRAVATGGVATASDGAVLVAVSADDHSSEVRSFSAEGSADRAYPLGRVGTVRALALGTARSLFVATATPAAILRVDLETGDVAHHVSIPDVPPCVPPAIATNCDASPVSNPPHPSALAFDRGANLFVADAGQGAIWRVEAATARVTQWFVHQSFATPMAANGPSGLAFDGAGNLVVSVAATLVERSGAIFVVTVRPDGSAGQLSLLHRSSGGARPGHLVLGQSGRVYVALRDPGSILVLARDGSVVGTLPREGELGLPVGLAFHGRSLVVPAQASRAGEAATVVRIVVGEAGGTVLPGA